MTLRRYRPRCSSSRWFRTATTCLVVATSPTYWISHPLAYAFASPYSSSFPKKLFTAKTNDCTSFTTHSSLSELLREFDYDALILDQFGVLHNGKYALEGTIECVETIAKGKPKNGSEAPKKKLKLIVLSNTSSPAQTTLDRLRTKLGFDESCFCGAVTSGEEAARHIRNVYGNDPSKIKKFVWCTWDVTNENVPDPTAFLELCGPNVVPTVDVTEADFVVAHGSGAIRGEDQVIRSMGSFLDDGNLSQGTPISDLLEQCADQKLPLICANPDMVVQYHDGSLKHMPGKIALRYREILEERDSTVSITIYGKPHTEHFEACLRELEEQRPESSKQSPLKVAHVGDSLHHDIAGANAAGIPSIFIIGGIHAEELISEKDSRVSEERLKEFFAKEGITPTHVLPVFQY